MEADNIRNLRRCRHLDDAEFLLLVWIVYENVEHEAVLLGFGQRVSAFLLDRILSGQNEKRIGQAMAGAAHGHLSFLHRFEKSRLGLGGSAIDLVRQNNIGEDRAVDEPKVPSAAFLLVEYRGAGDIRGHQIGRKLNALERHVENLTDGADHESLGQSRHSHEQAMAAREYGAQDLLDHFRLPDHDAATMDRLFSRSMPDWSDRAAVAEFAAARAEILGDDPAAARTTAERTWDRAPSTEPAVQMANHLGMVFARLDCKPRWRERLAELAIPALVVHGRRDAFFPVGNGEALAREIPDARLLVLKRAATAIPDAAVGEVAAAMLAL